MDSPIIEPTEEQPGQQPVQQPVEEDVEEVELEEVVAVQPITPTSIDVPHAPHTNTDAAPAATAPLPSKPATTGHARFYGGAFNMSDFFFSRDAEPGGAGLAGGPTSALEGLREEETGSPTSFFETAGTPRRDSPATAVAAAALPESALDAIATLPLQRPLQSDERPPRRRPSFFGRAAPDAAGEAGAALAPVVPVPEVRDTRKLKKKRTPTATHINQYRVLRVIGEGSFGKVKLAEEEGTGRLSAIKVVRRGRAKFAGKADPLERVQREIEILRKSRHPHVIRLEEVIDDPAVPKIYIGTSPFSCLACFSG